MNGSNYDMQVIEKDDLYYFERDVKYEMSEGWMPVGFTSYTETKHSSDYHSRETWEVQPFACMMVREKQDAE